MTDRPVLLLAEDEVLVADLVESALVEGGFAVVVVDSGESALTWLASNPKPFAGLITDIRMGRGADGWDVARRSRELRAGMPIVYMSGDSEADWTSKGVPGSVLVTKPFAPSQIVTAISDLLNAQVGAALADPQS